jgi:hypothetical protein
MATRRRGEVCLIDFGMPGSPRSGGESRGGGPKTATREPGFLMSGSERGFKPAVSSLV